MNILILGANGQIARAAIDEFLKKTDAKLTLYLRNARRLELSGHADRVRLVEGDVLDVNTLQTATVNQNLVYANLAGKLEQQARCIVKAMNATGVKRLIFISSMGIYDEVPGEHSGAILDPYRKAARVIESSGLDYTIIRPAWLNDQDEIDYATTSKGQPFEKQGGPAPVRRFLQHLMDLVLRREIEQGKVFDLSLPLADVAEGYRAMDERRAVKTLLEVA